MGPLSVAPSVLNCFKTRHGIRGDLSQNISKQYSRLGVSLNYTKAETRATAPRGLLYSADTTSCRSEQLFFHFSFPLTLLIGYKKMTCLKRNGFFCVYS